MAGMNMNTMKQGKVVLGMAIGSIASFESDLGVVGLKVRQDKMTDLRYGLKQLKDKTLKGNFLRLHKMEQRSNRENIRYRSLQKQIIKYGKDRKRVSESYDKFQENIGSLGDTQTRFENFKNKKNKQFGRLEMRLASKLDQYGSSRSGSSKKKTGSKWRIIAYFERFHDYVSNLKNRIKVQIREAKNLRKAQQLLESVRVDDLPEPVAVEGIDLEEIMSELREVVQDMIREDREEKMQELEDRMDQLWDKIYEDPQFYDLLDKQENQEPLTDLITDSDLAGAESDSDEDPYLQESNAITQEMVAKTDRISEQMGFSLDVDVDSDELLDYLKEDQVDEVDTPEPRKPQRSNSPPAQTKSKRSNVRKHWKATPATNNSNRRNVAPAQTKPEQHVSKMNPSPSQTGFNQLEFDDLTTFSEMEDLFTFSEMEDLLQVEDSCLDPQTSTADQRQEEQIRQLQAKLHRDDIAQEKARQEALRREEQQNRVVQAQQQRDEMAQEKQRAQAQRTPSNRSSATQFVTSGPEQWQNPRVSQAQPPQQPIFVHPQWRVGQQYKSPASSYNIPASLESLPQRRNIQNQTKPQQNRTTSVQRFNRKPQQMNHAQQNWHQIQQLNKSEFGEPRR